MPTLHPLNVARAYVTQSAQFALSERKKGPLKIEFKNKDINNVLTHVDLANSERAKAMLAHFLEAGEILIDEENLPSGTPEEVFASGQPLWVIDPIDGTRPYSENKSSWGVMLARVEGGKVTYANINMPSMKKALELRPMQSRVTLPNGADVDIEACPDDSHRLVTISQRLETLLPLAETQGFKNSYVPSAAEMTIGMALGEYHLIGLPSKAGFWDIAPAMLLADICGHVVCFESDPHTLLTLGPHMFQPNWQLRDNLVVTTRKTHTFLYGETASPALYATG